jgi:hypothetical protein
VAVRGARQREFECRPGTRARVPDASSIGRPSAFDAAAHSDDLAGAGPVHAAQRANLGTGNGQKGGT